jgi:hypothetical protein
MIYNNPLHKISRTANIDPKNYFKEDNQLCYTKYEFQVLVASVKSDQSIILDEEFQALAEYIGYSGRELELYKLTLEEISELIQENLHEEINGIVHSVYTYSISNGVTKIHLHVGVVTRLVDSLTARILTDEELRVLEFPMAYDIDYAIYKERIVAYQSETKSVEIGKARPKDLQKIKNSNHLNYEFLIFDPYQQYLYMLVDRSVESVDMNSNHASAIIQQIDQSKQEFYSYYSVDIESGIVNLNTIFITPYSTMD